MVRVIDSVLKDFHFQCLSQARRVNYFQRSVRGDLTKAAVGGGGWGGCLQWPCIQSQQK